MGAELGPTQPRCRARDRWASAAAQILHREDRIHLEPEVLIVDEVLAVGDAEFQKKCLRKMQDVAGHGRTVLFVSQAVDDLFCADFGSSGAPFDDHHGRTPNIDRGRLPLLNSRCVQTDTRLGIRSVRRQDFSIGPLAVRLQSCSCSERCRFL